MVLPDESDRVRLVAEIVTDIQEPIPVRECRLIMNTSSVFMLSSGLDNQHPPYDHSVGICHHSSLIEQKGVALTAHEQRQLEVRIASAKMAVLQARQAKEECVAREDYAAAEVRCIQYIFSIYFLFCSLFIFSMHFEHAVAVPWFTGCSNGG